MTAVNLITTLVRSVAMRFSTVIATLLTNSLEITSLRNYWIEFQESNCNGTYKFEDNNYNIYQHLAKKGLNQNIDRDRTKNHFLF